MILWTVFHLREIVTVLAVAALAYWWMQ